MFNPKLSLNIDQANKINRMLPRGYKLLSVEEMRKKQTQSKKKAKIVYVPVEQSSRDPPPRRKNQPISYYEGEGIQQNTNIKNVYYDSQISQQRKKYNSEVQKIKTKITPSLTFSLPPPPPVSPPILQSVYQQRSPYTSKQIIQKIKKHPKFYVIVQLRDDFSSYTFDRLVSKCNQSNFSLNQLQNQLQDLFITIYESYNRALPIYNDAAQLQSYINSMISAQKARLKQQPKQQILVDQSPNLILNRAPSSLNRKKTIIPKPEAKNITIMDKRILGQNIKKLPSECLPQICRIVYETIETREEYIIDIDTLPLKKVKQLQFYVGGCIQKLDGFVDSQLKNDGDSSQSSFIIADDFD